MTKREMLKRIKESDRTIVVLKDLKFKKNLYEENIAIESIIYDKDDYKFYYLYLNCYSSFMYGFGSCNCTNHRAFEHEEINANEALKIINRN